VNISNGSNPKGYNIPLVAVIHFYPPLPCGWADFVDKVRINPGNFVDKRALIQIDLTMDDANLCAGIWKKIEEKFTPLV